VSKYTLCVRTPSTSLCGRMGGGKEGFREGWGRQGGVPEPVCVCLCVCVCVRARGGGGAHERDTQADGDGEVESTKKEKKKGQEQERKKWTYVDRVVEDLAQVLV
jgi:hypothetical protein